METTNPLTNGDTADCHVSDVAVISTHATASQTGPSAPGDVNAAPEQHQVMCDDEMRTSASSCVMQVLVQNYTHSFRSELIRKLSVYRACGGDLALFSRHVSGRSSRRFLPASVCRENSSSTKLLLRMLTAVVSVVFQSVIFNMRQMKLNFTSLEKLNMSCERALHRFFRPETQTLAPLTSVFPVSSRLTLRFFTHRFFGPCDDDGYERNIRFLRMSLSSGECDDDDSHVEYNTSSVVSTDGNDVSMKSLHGLNEAEDECVVWVSEEIVGLRFTALIRYTTHHHLIQRAELLSCGKPKLLFNPD
ncbi:hypothetical protein IRJ41_020571 [Triplophysa rosa]|uniref:Uncharacterized protein n=1 Tax=Triplophysa rosa TaxID=992332 RepID=A0A9W8C724_TRIRA|nr:hypothetical protein IRJ41_020571 [Triplophysa rosa]